jgi:hypothetical protein
MTPQQIPLFFDTYEAAIRSAVDAIGGLKVVGSMLWPTKEPDEAGRTLAACLNPEKREKLDLNELRMIRREARKRGIHVLAAYEARDAGYADPQPVEPEDERARLMREFIEASKRMEALHANMRHHGMVS